MKRIILSLTTILISLGCFADNLKYVNVFMGSEGDHGQTTPAALVPFGMVSVCPDSDPWQHGGYDYAVPEISGISINRISGVGCNGSGGNLSIRPARQNDPLRIVKGTEKAWPGFYGTSFSNGSKGRFTATKDMAVEEYTFGRADRVLFVNFLSAIDKRGIEAEYTIEDSNTITGWVKCATTCAFGRYKIYFVLRTNHSFEVESSDKGSATLCFDSRNVEVRIAISPVDLISACAFMDSHAGKTFSKIASDAKKLWQEKLNRFQVKGSTEEQKYLFYTSLYLLYHSPMNVTTLDGRYLGTDGKIYQVSEGHTYYSSWSMWDTFRTKFPLLSIIEPSVSKDISWSLASQFATGKQNWATPFESCPTVRTEHSVIIMLDNYLKGLATIDDLNLGYEGMVDEIDNKLQLRGLDHKLEAAYDIWAMAQISGFTGHKEDQFRFEKRSQDLFTDIWKNHFMDIDDSFTRMRGSGLYQGTKWQLRWMLMEYVDKAIEWAGAERLCDELSTYFERYYFNQGNEPDIQTPFLFNRFGAPDKTCEIVREYLTNDEMIHIYGGNAEYPKPFVGRAFQNKLDGYAPEMDEDDGAMSAWYLFCQMGFYPLLVGSDTYEIFSPLFDSVKMNIEGKKITIKATGRKDYADKIQSISMNGKVLPERQIPHYLFSKGGVLEFNYKTNSNKQ